MARTTRELTDAQWAKLAHCCYRNAPEWAAHQRTTA
jgi:hypothetical protein